MVILDPELAGRHVRLEPLQLRHLAGLVGSVRGDPELYRMSKVPVGDAEVGALHRGRAAARGAGRRRRSP